jgi:hypothetical protein
MLARADFHLADEEGSPQFAGNIHWLAVQRDYRDSSAPKGRGPQNDTRQLFHPQAGDIWLHSLVRTALAPSLLQRNVVRKARALQFLSSG